MARCF